MTLWNLQKGVISVKNMVILYINPMNHYNQQVYLGLLKWGYDIIGPIYPPSSKGTKFILTATDYFSKWAKAVPLKEVKAENVEDFITTNLIYRFGVPGRMISDNGPSYKNRKIERMCTKFKIKHHFSTGYNLTANGHAKALNKVLCKLLKKVVSQNKRHCHEKLLESL